MLIPRRTLSAREGFVVVPVAAEEPGRAGSVVDKGSFGSEHCSKFC